MKVSLKLIAFCILLLAIGLMPENVFSIDDEFIVVDGINVRRSERMKVQTEQKGNEEQVKIKESLVEEEARLYNESEDITKYLPNKCQGLLMN